MRAAATVWSPLLVPGEVPIAGGRVGDGPDPVVAIHGITSQHRAFNAVARALAHPSGMAAVDLRGRGDSGKPAEGYGLDVHTADVLRALDHLGVAEPVLVGHSMGAFVAEQVALTAPERVRALVLLDGGWPRESLPPGADLPRDPDMDAGLARSFGRLGRTFPSLDAYVDLWFPGQGLRIEDLPPDLADYFRYDLAPVDGGWRPKAELAAVVADGAWIVTHGATAAELAALRCPTVLVRATEGFLPGSPPVVSAQARATLAATLDLAAELTLDGANHQTMLYQPHAATIAATIDRVAAGAAGGGAR
jgi:lipase